MDTHHPGSLLPQFHLPLLQHVQPLQLPEGAPIKALRNVSFPHHKGLYPKHPNATHPNPKHQPHPRDQNTTHPKPTANKQINPKSKTHAPYAASCTKAMLTWSTRTATG